MKLKFQNKLWKYQGKAAWYFITLPGVESSKLRLEAMFTRKAFGSIRIKAKILDQEWKTSVFPDAKNGTYLLPVKAEIRKKTNIWEGDLVEVEIENI